MSTSRNACSSIHTLARRLCRTSTATLSRSSAPVASQHGHGRGNGISYCFNLPRQYRTAQRAIGLNQFNPRKSRPDPNRVYKKPAEIPPEDTTISIQFPGRNSPTLLDRHWLRDSCDCSLCMDPDSGQKNFNTCDVPTELPIKETSKTEDGGLQVIWENDFLTSEDHVSRLSAAKVAALSKWPYKFAERELPKEVLWDGEAFKRDQIIVDYDEWMDGMRGFLAGFNQIHTHGILIIRNVPPSEESVISIANQIGHIQETFYGRTWDVRSKPRAENVAYTNSFLGLHQDMLYLRDPPRIQLLHCLENTCEGGESLFSDGTRAGYIIHTNPIPIKDDLTSKYVRYSYKKNGHDYEYTRPILALNNIVSWSPLFQDSNQTFPEGPEGIAKYHRWLQAATRLRHLIEDEQWVYHYKMQPGECVVFDNQRVLHGRRGFDTSSGNRWLKGTYVSSDAYKSKLFTMSEELLELGRESNLSLVDWAKFYRVKYNLDGYGKNKDAMPEWEITSTNPQDTTEDDTNFW
ncbi:hypothetical protein AAE478_004991 [Parahypoxylon ruwenzoriense]